MYKYAKFHPNIPCGSRVMNIFTNWPRLTGLMLSKASSIKKGYYTYKWLDNVDRGVWWHWCRASNSGARGRGWKPTSAVVSLSETLYSPKVLVIPRKRWLRPDTTEFFFDLDVTPQHKQKAMLTCLSMQNLIKIYHVVQELWAFSQRTDGRTDGLTQIIVHTCGSIVQ